MKTLMVSLLALSLFGCNSGSGGSSSGGSSGGSLTQTAGPIESVVYSFAGGSDGANPLAGLIAVHGYLYSTTLLGGGNQGTIFGINQSTGAETVVHTFGKGNDGNGPSAGLIAVNGYLYGTTYSAESSFGTVFWINPSTGVESVVYSFAGINGNDGAFPEAGLIAVGGYIYGTTTMGGSTDNGTVFSINLSTGAESVVYSFGNGIDGVAPFAELITVGNYLYGTTYLGGEHGAGTVFSINLSTGAESVVHSFGNGDDGANPLSGLIEVNGYLYGTTSLGGKANDGTVFIIDASTGAEKLVYSFGSDNDGANPKAGLIMSGGYLYGTTSTGGKSGYGTVFSINASTGAETVVYSFAGGSDGANPVAGLIELSGYLYGTTYAGGSNNQGTVFWVNPKN